MRVEVDVNMLTWAIERAGYDPSEFAQKMPQVTAWLNDERKPTVKQLEDFSKKYHYQPEAINEFLDVDKAEAFLVAYALQDIGSRVLVTHEVS